MLFCHLLKCVLWTRKTSLSSLSPLAFNFGCFFLCSFQISVWSYAIRIPWHLDFLLIWPFLIVFSSSSQPGPWVAKGTVWPGGGTGRKRAAGFVLWWTGPSPVQPGALWALPSLHHPKLRPPNSQLLPASQTRPRRVCSPLPTRLSLNHDTAAVLPVKNLPNFKYGKDITGAPSMITHWVFSVLHHIIVFSVPKRRTLLGETPYASSVSLRRYLCLLYHSFSNGTQIIES